MDRTRATPSRRLRAAVTLAAFLTALVAGVVALAPQTAAAQGGRATVGDTTVVGAITPVVSRHLQDAVAAAGRDGHAALLVRLDTPGGLITSMREIVQSFLNAPLPVIVYVSPSGADAGSAGTFITLAAHVAAMAPATTIGAATPVDLEGGEVGDKIVNNAAAYAEAIAVARGRDVDFAVASVREGRSVTADRALEIGAVDLVAATVEDLLDEVDGRSVEVRGGPVTLATAGATLVPLEMSWSRRLLQRLADPNLAFLFISIGTLAIVYEVANPGLGAGGVIGAVMLILAFFSLSVLPLNYAGVALVILAAGMFVAEVFAPGVGVGAAGGTVALVLGGLFLFQEPTGVGVDLAVILPTVVVVAVLVILAGRIAARSRHQPVTDLTSELHGRRAEIFGSAEGRPRVRLDGTVWRARSAAARDLELQDGMEVEVVDHENLDLIVEPVRETES